MSNNPLKKYMQATHDLWVKHLKVIIHLNEKTLLAELKIQDLKCDLHLPPNFPPK
jgi:hypothetical protein